MDLKSTVEAYVAAWNETDANRRRGLLELCLSQDIRILNAGEEIRGRAAVDAQIVDFHQRRPGAIGRLSSAIEGHGRAFRFAAVVEDPALAQPIELCDAGEVDASGRICLILTFVGAAPPKA